MKLPKHGSSFHIGAGFLRGNVLHGVEILICISFFLIILARVLHRGQNQKEFGDAGLYGVLGRMGAGKSYFLAYVAHNALGRGRLVFANYPLTGSKSWAEFEDFVRRAGRCVLYDRNGQPNGWKVGVIEGEPEWTAPVIFENWQQHLINVPNNSLVLLDEVHLWWSSRAWRVPVEVEQWITQLRKRKITVFWASQDIVSVSRRLRGLTFAIWESERFKTGHRYSMYDPIQAGRITTQTRPRLARVVMTRKKAVMALYDTYGIVGVSDEWGGDEVGRPDTEGRRNRPDGAEPTLRVVEGGA